jgi:hypothetical protein
VGAVLNPGERLNAGEELVSDNGLYHLLMQPDGNLVHYHVGGRTLWNTETSTLPAGLRPAYAELRNDGNFVLYSSADLPAYETGTPPLKQLDGDPDWVPAADGCRLIVGDEGNVIIYSPDGTVRWANNAGGVEPVGPNGGEVAT